jgi:heme-degrading monooxygenase HmoA
MIAVIFEVQPHSGKNADYLQAAERLRPLLSEIDGFISIERFESLSRPGRILSLSYWRDEHAVQQWRNVEAHRIVQAEARRSIFADYELRVATIIRHYGMNDRTAAPDDSRLAHE